MKYTREKLIRKINSHFIRRIGPLPIYPYCYRAKWHALLHRKSKAVSSKGTNVTYFAARPNPGAGIGHQMANWIAGFYYAQHFGLQFAHIPFPDSEWERLLGFGIDEAPMETLLKKEGYRKVRLPQFKHPDEIAPIVASYAGQRVVLLAERDQGLKEQHLIAESLQCKYHRVNSVTGLNFSKDVLNIAIHVRRGDIMAGGKAAEGLANRFQKIEYFENILRSVLAATEGRPRRVYLFSQEGREAFQALEALHPIEFCLDMGAHDSFRHMVMADILITSKSSFSFMPALLSHGIKICPKDFWQEYPVNSSWILATEKGEVDKGHLAGELFEAVNFHETSN